MPCLRAVPLSAIVAAVNGKPSTCKFLPIIDGSFLPDYPSTLLRESRFHKMPFIGGHCTDDGSIFVGAPSGIINTTDGFIAALRKRMNSGSKGSATSTHKVGKLNGKANGHNGVNEKKLE